MGALMRSASHFHIWRSVLNLRESGLVTVPSSVTGQTVLSGFWPRLLSDVFSPLGAQGGLLSLPVEGETLLILLP